MFLLYNIALTFLAPLWVPWMWLRTRRRAEAPIWQQRFGNYKGVVEPKEKGRTRIWVHAVSVGEVIAARPFLKELRRQSPSIEIVLSVTTSSGYKTASDSTIGLFDALVYLPIDVARFTLSAMQQVRPDALVIMETELWYNLLWAADTFDVPCMVVNGRISDRAHRANQKIRWFYRSLFKLVGRVLVQTETDKQRFEFLGAKNVEVLGNTKFDEAAATPDGIDWFGELGIDRDKPVVVVGSTRSELEEQWIRDAFVASPGVTFVHAPRHIETAAGIEQGAKALPGAVVGKRSEKQGGNYIILDTFGELGRVYQIADVAIIGGGFDNLGGQNLIQPLAAGKPVLHGTHMQNFRDVAAMSLARGASIACESSEDLAGQLNRLLANPEERKAMGEKAKALVEENVGASARYAAAVISATQPLKKK